MDLQRKNRNRSLRILINLFWFLIIFFLTHITPVSGDDIVLAHVFFTDQPIQNAHDFFSSIWIHQMTWGGHPVAWGVMQAFAIMPRIVFELCNGLVWIGAATLMCRFACTALALEAGERPLALCLTHLALWFFSPSLHQMLWLNGSMAYFWFNTGALLLGYYFYRREWERTERSLRPGRRIAVMALLLVLGFAVGASVSPPTGCAVLAGFGLCLLWKLWKKRGLDGLMFIAALGILIGFCISVFSPGNAARSALVAERTPYTASLLFRLARTFFHGLRHSLVPLGIIGLFTVLNRSRRSWLELDELFFVFLAFVNVAVMAIPNGYAPRTVLFSSMLLVIAVVRSGLRLVTESPACQQPRPSVRKALWVLVAFLTLYMLLQVAIGTLMHFRQGTTFEKETLYFLVNYDIFK